MSTILTTIEKIEIILQDNNKIGQGGQGLVYKLEYKDKIVAIKKVILTNHITFNEVNILSNLRHKNIVKYIDYAIKNLTVYLVMEYCETTLKEQIGKQELDIRLVGRDILNGLYYLHYHNIIHRDIKPSNILYNNDTYIICDFGFSKNIDYSSESITIQGTPGYYPPEAWNGTGLTKKSDIWSFGMTIVEILNGSLPDRKKPDDTNKIVKIIIEKCNFSQLTQELLKCFEIDKNQRPSAFFLLTNFNNVPNNIMKSEKIISKEYQISELKTKHLQDLNLNIKNTILRFGCTLGWNLARYEIISSGFGEVTRKVIIEKKKLLKEIIYLLKQDSFPIDDFHIDDKVEKIKLGGGWVK